MTPDQQDNLILEIVNFTMPDGSPISQGVKADVIIAQFGIPNDVPQLRRLIALGASQLGQKVRRRLSRG